MRFDAYAATVEVPIGPFLDQLLDRFAYCQPKPLRPVHGYQQAYGFDYDGRTVMTVQGENPAAPGSHVSGQGEIAEALSRFMRSEHPGHRVSRMDPCADYTAPGSWDAISGAMLKVADERGLKVLHIGDFHRGLEGRTIYVGATTSAVRARGYEKGKQLRSAGLEDADLNHVRLEMQVRPPSRLKAAAAVLTPAQAFTAFATWSGELYAQLTGDGPPEVHLGNLRPPSDEARKLDWMLRQYGPTLRALEQRTGSPEALGRFLVDALDARERDRG